jgi:hypothetical protein
MKDATRIGTFSSSQNYRLMSDDRSGKGAGKPFYTYVKQVKYENQLGRAINKDVSPRPCTWGDLVERIVYDKLPFGQGYKLVSEQRLFHPLYTEWSGAADMRKTPNAIGDIKVPYSLEQFCDKITALEAGWETYKKEFPEDAWQHVSNTILWEANGHKVDYVEPIIFCPYEAELDEIRELANNYTGDQNKVAWINWASNDELPYLIEGGHYKNLNIFRFEIPQADKDALTERVKMAIEKLKELDNSKYSNAA